VRNAGAEHELVLGHAATAADRLGRQ
jgi:hypothetical protein